MTRYCLDANVLIQAKNGPYGFDIFPVFWDWLDYQTSTGVIFTSTLVYNEWVSGNDDLAQWVKDRKDTGLFIEPDTNVQTAYKDIANYIKQNFSDANAQVFLDGADPWVISHAKVENATVVTHEVLVPRNAKKIKIPNICREFGVPCLNSYKMLKNLNAKFS